MFFFYDDNQEIDTLTKKKETEIFILFFFKKMSAELQIDMELDFLIENPGQIVYINGIDIDGVPPLEEVDNNFNMEMNDDAFIAGVNEIDNNFNVEMNDIDIHLEAFLDQMEEITEEAEQAEEAEQETDLNTLAFYPLHIPHIFVNVSEKHWEEMKVNTHICSICHDHFQDSVTELNCTHGKDGKHFFCKGCADEWWSTCIHNNNIPTCACCRTVSSSAVTWVKPHKRKRTRDGEPEVKRARI